MPASPEMPALWHCRPFERPTGAIPKNTANPPFPFLPVPPAGAEGGQPADAAKPLPLSQTGQFHPPRNFGWKLSRNKQRAGAKRPTIRRRIGGRHDGKDAGVPFARRRLHQRAGGRRSRSRQRRERSEPRKHATAKPGCLPPGWMPFKRPGMPLGSDWVVLARGGATTPQTRPHGAFLGRETLFSGRRQLAH